MPPPILYFAFANNPNNPRRHLNTLVEEYRQLSRILRANESTFSYDPILQDQADLDTLFADFTRYRNRITIFHFGGHANETHLFLQHLDGEVDRINKSGFARLLGEMENLQVVFLNGCATEGHVQTFLNAGVPAVIATSAVIADDKATQFSINFYTSLLEGLTIEQAFEAARGYLESRGIEVSFVRERPLPDSFQWGIYSNSEGEDIPAKKLKDLQVRLEPIVFQGSRISARGILTLIQENVLTIVGLSASNNQLRGSLPVRVPTDRYGSSLFDWRPYNTEESGIILHLLREYQRESGYTIRFLMLQPCVFGQNAYFELEKIKDRIAFIVDCFSLNKFDQVENQWLSILNSPDVGGCLIPICRTYPTTVKKQMFRLREKHLSGAEYYFKDYRGSYVQIELEVPDKWTLFRRLNTIAFEKMRLRVPKQLDTSGIEGLPSDLEEFSFDLQ
ncbi:MAG: CHAT domain-containing protein [Bacteroidota bacterium]